MWYRNEKPLYQDSIKMGEHQTTLLANFSLVLHNVTEGQVGQYKCSILGQKDSKVVHQVLVKTKPTIISLTAKNKQVYFQINHQSIHPMYISFYVCNILIYEIY